MQDRRDPDDLDDDRPDHRQTGFYATELLALALEGNWGFRHFEEMLDRIEGRP